MPDDPTQPGQLPGQQFSVANDSTRSQSRMAKLEERVKQLEKGKQTVFTPVFKWDQPQNITNTTSYTWAIDLPVPQYSSTGVTVTEAFYWFRFGITAVGGTVAAPGSNISVSMSDTHTWAYTLGGSAFANFAPNLGTTASSVHTAAGAEKSTWIETPVLLSSPFGSFSTINITITKGGGTATGVTVTNGRLYAIIPTTFTT